MQTVPVGFHSFRSENSVRNARPAGFEPATCGLAYHYSFRCSQRVCPDHRRGCWDLWSGLPLRPESSSGGGAYSLYGASSEIHLGFHGVAISQDSPLQHRAFHTFPYGRSYRSPLLYPTELRAQVTFRGARSAPEQDAQPVVGAAGFEPATSCSQSRCANRTAPRPARRREKNGRSLRSAP